MIEHPTQKKGSRSAEEIAVFEQLRESIAFEFGFGKEITHICAELTDNEWDRWAALEGFPKTGGVVEKLRFVDRFLQLKLTSKEFEDGSKTPDLNRFRPWLTTMVIRKLRDRGAQNIAQTHVLDSIHATAGELVQTRTSELAARRNTIDFPEDIDRTIQDINLLRRYGEAKQATSNTYDLSIQRYRSPEELAKVTNRWKPPQYPRAEIEALAKKIEDKLNTRGKWGDWESLRDFPRDKTMQERVGYIETSLRDALKAKILPSDGSVVRRRISHEDCLPWLLRSALDTLANPINYSIYDDFHFRFPEDLPKAVDDIDLLRKRAKGEAANLGMYHSCVELARVVEKWRDHSISLERLNHARKIYVKEFGGNGSAELLDTLSYPASDGGLPETLEAYAINSYAAASRYKGFGSERWCTARSEDTYREFDQLVILIHQPSMRRWQIDLGTGHASDQNDSRLRPEQLFEAFLGLDELLKPLFVKGIKPFDEKAVFRELSAVWDGGLRAETAEQRRNSLLHAFRSLNQFPQPLDESVVRKLVSSNWVGTQKKEALEERREDHLAGIVNRAELCAAYPLWQGREFFDLLVQALPKATRMPLRSFGFSKSTCEDFLLKCKEIKNWRKWASEELLGNALTNCARNGNYTGVHKVIELAKDIPSWRKALAVPEGMSRAIAIIVAQFEQELEAHKKRNRSSLLGRVLNRKCTPFARLEGETPAELIKVCMGREWLNSSISGQSLISLLRLYANNVHLRLNLKGVFEIVENYPEHHTALAESAGIPAVFDALRMADQSVSQKDEETKDYIVDQAIGLINLCHNYPSLVAKLTKKQLVAFTKHEFSQSYCLVAEIMNLFRGDQEREAQLVNKDCLPVVFNRHVSRVRSDQKLSGMHMGIVLEIVNACEGSNVYCQFMAQPKFLPALLKDLSGQTGRFARLSSFIDEGLAIMPELRASLDRTIQGKRSGGYGLFPIRPGNKATVTDYPCHL